jgi:hypothetical protein
VVGASRALSHSVVTDAGGAFSLVVDDPAEKPQGPETGGKLTVSTADNQIGNADESISGTTAFGSGKGKVKIKLKGEDAGNKVDKLRVVAPRSVAGETVKIYRVVDGKLELVKTKKVRATGQLKVTVKDKNGADVTTYLAKLQSSQRVKGAKSKKLPLE